MSGAPVMVTPSGELIDLPNRMRAIRYRLGVRIDQTLSEIGDDAVDRVSRAALSTLPVEGGLAASVAHSRPSVDRQPGGITLRLSEGLAAIDDGHLRHPVFGNPDVMVDQPIRPGYFSRTLEDMRPDMQTRIDRMVKELETTIR